MNFEIQSISEDNYYLVEDFQTFQTELKDFLVEDSITHQEKMITKTFMWIDKESNKLAGYLTICNDSIKLHNVDEKLQELLDTKRASFDFLPAMKLAKICIDDRYRRKGIGRLMMSFCISLCLDINKKNRL